MAKDYKNAERANRRRSGGGSLLLGILIGLILGLGIALVVAWYINRGPSPFLGRQSGAKTEAPSAATSAPAATKDEDRKAGVSAEAKPRFDFYKILPGNEEPATDQQLRDAQKKSTASAKEAFFLQAGAFQSASDADNLKARLALLGIEATIQATSVPDKGLWHRVRVGPYTSVEELTRTRDTLKQNGLETSLIKVREGSGR
jgi:cell division protein FtsN